MKQTFKRSDFKVASCAEEARNWVGNGDVQCLRLHNYKEKFQTKTEERHRRSKLQEEWTDPGK